MAVGLILGAGGLLNLPPQAHTFTVTGLHNNTNFPANSTVVVAFYNYDGSGAFVSPTIGGLPATLLYDYNDYKGFLFSVNVGGSSIPDTIGGVNGDYYNRLFFRAWILTGAGTPTLSGDITNTADPITFAAPLNVPPGGAGVVLFGCNNPSGVTNITWGLPVGSTPGDGAASSSVVYAVGTWNTTTAGTWNPGANGSAALAYRNNCMLAAVFPPAGAPPASAARRSLSTLGVA